MIYYDLWTFWLSTKQKVLFDSFGLSECLTIQFVIKSYLNF